MEVPQAIRARRMVRSFTDESLSPDLLDHLCDLARRGPSAGNSQGAGFLVLDDPSTVARYWDLTLPEPRRAKFRWPGLVVAPALVILAVRPDTYVERYGEADKVRTGLGDSTDAWPV
ncbi:MAG: nitroreductase family protein, partial [Aquihabitans sp.]